MVRRGTLLFLLVTSAAAQDPDPAAALLKKTDSKLWFADRQPKLGSYSARLFNWTTFAAPGAAVEPKPKDDVGKLVVMGKERTLTGQWQPYAGPWRLQHVSTWLVDLFAVPWSERFAQWTRTVDEDGLTLKPKAKIGTASMLMPAIKSVRFRFGEDGLPKDGLLFLDMEHFRPQAPITFHFEDGRIKKIELEIDAANLKVRPVYEFRYKVIDGLTLVSRVDCRLPGRYIKGGMKEDIVSSLQFRDYKVRKRE